MPSIHDSSTSAGCEETRRLARRADAGGRAGEDDVAGEQRQHGRQLGDEPRHGEDEIGRARVLHGLAVDRAAEREVVGIGHLVGRDEPRAHRPESAPRLAERELRARGELERAVADVLSHGEAGDVRPRVGFVHAIGARADHRDQLDFPVDRVADDLDVVERSRQRGGEFGERRRHGRDRQARLLGVTAVVQPDREHLAGLGYGTPELRFHERRSSGGHARREVDERRPVVEDAHHVGTEPAAGRVVDVGDRVVDDDRGPPVVVGQLHRVLPSAR